MILNMMTLVIMTMVIKVIIIMAVVIKILVKTVKYPGRDWDGRMQWPIL